MAKATKKKVTKKRAAKKAALPKVPVIDDSNVEIVDNGVDLMVAPYKFPEGESGNMAQVGVGSEEDIADLKLTEEEPVADTRVPAPAIHPQDQYRSRAHIARTGEAAKPNWKAEVAPVGEAAGPKARAAQPVRRSGQIFEKPMKFGDIDS